MEVGYVTVTITVTASGAMLTV